MLQNRGTGSCRVADGCLAAVLIAAGGLSQRGTLPEYHKENKTTVPASGGASWRLSFPPPPT